MFAFPRKTKYPSDAQLEIWIMNRNKISGKEIAKRKDVTQSFVSKTLKITLKRFIIILTDWKS